MTILSFLQNVVLVLLRSPPSRALVFDQIWSVSVGSALTTLISGFFVGAIMTIQFSMQLVEFSALAYLGGLSTSGTIREVGPLLIAFMLSGKVGAFTSAELALMRITEQMDAVRCLGADPFREIIAPRFIAIVVSSFFLLILGLAMSILGGLCLAHLFYSIELEEYVRFIPATLTLNSVLGGLLKCLCFSLMLASVCTYKGYTATGGARGVGKAVVSTAVVSMVGIVILDWVTSFLARLVEGAYL